MLVAGRHYVPLALDHSNISEVVAIIRSPERASPIIEAAHREVACNKAWWLGTMIEAFDSVVAEEYRNRIAAHREVRSFNQRLASELAGQWSSCKRWGVLASEHSSYRAAYDSLVAAYGSLAAAYGSLAAAYGSLAEAYQNSARRSVSRVLNQTRYGKFAVLVLKKAWSSATR